MRTESLRQRGGVEGVEGLKREENSTELRVSHIRALPAHIPHIEFRSIARIVRLPPRVSQVVGVGGELEWVADGEHQKR